MLIALHHVTLCLPGEANQDQNRLVSRHTQTLQTREQEEREGGQGEGEAEQHRQLEPLPRQSGGPGRERERERERERGKEVRKEGRKEGKGEGMRRSGTRRYFIGLRKKRKGVGRWERGKVRVAAP